jgi:hypothetical protein
MATQYAFGKIVTNGLVLALDAADRNSYPGSGTTWRDMSGNNNSGSLINGPTFNSANGGAIVFDGTDDYTNLSSNIGLPSGNTSHTVSCWIYKQGDNTSNGWVSLINWGTNSNNQKRFLFVSSNAANNNRIYTGYYNNDNNWGTGIANNIWTHLAWTFNGSSESIYLNGSLYGSRSVSNVNTVLSTNKDIGGYFDTGFISYYNGRISNLQLYNISLPASEILQNYNAQKSRFNL